MKTVMVWSSVLICGALVVAAPGAHAQQFGLSAKSDASYSVSYDRYYSNSVTDARTGLVGPVSSNASTSLRRDTYAYGNSDVSAVVRYDLLHAEGGGSGESGGGSGGSTVHWFDTLTVSSGTLALNTPVSLLMTVHYTGSLNAYAYDRLPSGVDSGSAKTQVTFDTGVGSTHLTFSGSVSRSFYDLSSTPNNEGEENLQIDKTLQQTVSTYVGAVLPMNAQIDFSSYGSASGFKASGGASGNVDALFGITSQTSGVTLLRASTAVPEPSTLALLLGVIPARRSLSGVAESSVQREAASPLRLP